jgi:hypothetical protein
MMVCIAAQPYNNKGQSVSWNTLYTKAPGCSNPLDLVDNENCLRPKYGSYINFNMQGIEGDSYWDEDASNAAISARNWQQSRSAIGPSFSNQWASTNYQTCSLFPYENAMAAEEARRIEHANSSFISNNNLRNAGM